MMLSDEAQKLIEEIWRFVAPLAGPAGGATIGYIAAHKKMGAEASKIYAESDAIQLDSLTKHFQALIEGYELRVKDLTDEVEQLRTEVKSLRKALDSRPILPR
jgi:hypothetical protein